jgi:hypothetical protein
MRTDPVRPLGLILGIGLAWGNALLWLALKSSVVWIGGLFKHALGTQALRYGKPLTVIGALIGVFSLANQG